MPDFISMQLNGVGDIQYIYNMCVFLTSISSLSLGYFFSPAELGPHNPVYDSQSVAPPSKTWPYKRWGCIFDLTEGGEAVEDGNQSLPKRQGSHGARFKPARDEMRWDPTPQKPQPVY